MNEPLKLEPKKLKEWLTFTELAAVDARRMALALLDDREVLRADRDRLASLLDKLRHAAATHIRAALPAPIGDNGKASTAAGETIPAPEEGIVWMGGKRFRLECDGEYAGGKGSLHYRLEDADG